MLIDRDIQRAKVKAKPYRLTDGRGLYVQVTPAGGKLWRFKYRHDGREKLLSLGQYPDVSIAMAREQHAAARRQLTEGIDPAAQRRAEKGSGSHSREIEFGRLAALWLEHWRVDKSRQHVDATWRRLNANVFPILGGRPAATVEAPELVAMVKSIELRGAGDLAKRALETTGQIFRYGVAHGHCKRNPAADVKPADVLRPTVKTNLARVGEDALPGLLQALEIYSGKPLTRLATKLMAYTFPRTSELIGGEWPEIDWERARWVIPAARMKMRSPHIIPLSSQALEILRLIHRVSGEGLKMFPGEQGNSTMSGNTILFALARMGYKGDMTGHGFRGLASTLLHEQGWPHEHIELQLAHCPRNAVSAAYNHALYLEPRAKMMQAWGDYLEAKTKSVDRSLRVV